MLAAASVRPRLAHTLGSEVSGYDGIHKWYWCAHPVPTTTTWDANNKSARDVQEYPECSSWPVAVAGYQVAVGVGAGVQREGTGARVTADGDADGKHGAGNRNDDRARVLGAWMIVHVSWAHGW